MTRRFLIAAALCAAMTAAAAAAGDKLQDAPAPDKASASALIEQADALRLQAAELQFEWRWTGQHIKDARQALEEGRLKDAQALAARARREAELAIEQAKKAESVWKITAPR